MFLKYNWTFTTFTADGKMHVQIVVKSLFLMQLLKVFTPFHKYSDNTLAEHDAGFCWRVAAAFTFKHSCLNHFLLLLRKWFEFLFDNKPSWLRHEAKKSFCADSTLTVSIKHKQTAGTTVSISSARSTCLTSCAIMSHHIDAQVSEHFGWLLWWALLELYHYRPHTTGPL